jgi:hypothetical protein
MTVNNATQRPWEVSSYAFGDYVQAPDGTEIAKTIEKSASLPDLEREANAALIVTAVNVHDALMAVYEAADAAMVFLAENGYGGTPVESALLDALEGCAAVIGEVK